MENTRKTTKKEPLFRGIGTALITPFSYGNIDETALSNLIERQLQAGIPALIVGGTTGEAATLTDDERYALFDFCIRKTDGRAKVICGTGTNDTEKAIRHTERAKSLGADGALVVTPYYNKGTERGLFLHYETIAKAVNLPLILYNVPSRTGVNLSLSLVKKLSKKETIVGIKEASDSAERLAKLSTLSDTLPLYAGNDAATFAVLAQGGCGCISVVSNLYPERMMRLWRLFESGDPAAAKEEQSALFPLIDALFCETNPAPIKYAMSLCGLCSEEMRLPLAPLYGKSKAKVRRAIEKA